MFQIQADPKIQLLSGLLSVGIYFDIEDKDLNIQSFRSKSFVFGIFLLAICIFRSFYLITPLDKYYYLLLPFGISSISLLGKQVKKNNSFRNIIFLSFLLPSRRLFFYLFNPILLFLTKYLTYVFLLCLGTNPILEGRSIFINRSELIISTGCGGTDNMFFVICSVIIYLLTLKLRNPFNLKIVYFLMFFVPLLTNVIRNALLAIFINLETNNKDVLFYFFHDSYGSLIFSLFSVLILSFIYFKLLNEELN
ncbi:archaeosortase/exosortase family protein [Prochlorococcus marinus XMU1410]|nr:archaeosortase/exosortase family protein [Prochlorococcus marinus]MBO8242364.1 archaeosortase/exosortase family protein [Prochlorococcus marinus XMU1410]